VESHPSDRITFVAQTAQSLLNATGVAGLVPGRDDAAFAQESSSERWTGDSDAAIGWQRVGPAAEGRDAARWRPRH